VIRLATEHHAIKTLRRGTGAFMGGQATVQNDGEIWKLGFQPMDDVVAQGRHFSIFFWAETIEPGVSGMHNKKITTRRSDRANEVAHKVIPLMPPKPDSMLDRYRD
jgi:hypothetical protein